MSAGTPSGGIVGQADPVPTLTLPTYRTLPGRFDEMIGPDGSVRPVWGSVADTVFGLTDSERAERAAAAERRLVATGAAHSHDGRPAGAWQIDPVPLVLGEPDWSRLSAGLEQRVRLLDLVLDDLYGDRLVVSQGLVPAELVLGADGYQPAAWGWAPREVRITRYAADVVRVADGSFRVLRDHADAPSGAARALVNRVVTTRVMSDVASLGEVVSLNSFFDRLRDALATSAASAATSPRVVVLAPPPSDPEFIEYSLLATHMGYNVVEAADLVVSGGRVWLRAVAGHEPVAVIVRGVTDPSTDALEMLPFRAGGVPGLVQAAREGAVTLANSAGTGIASSLALQPFLQPLCRRLLGEDLLLESPESVWCGDSVALDRVMADLDAFVLHDACSHLAQPSVFGDELSGDERDRWVARLRRAPFRYVAQPKLELATVPVLRRGELRPGHVTVRMHATHSPTGTWVMPGGTGRVVDPGVPIARQASRASKDVWVMSADAAARSLRVDGAPAPAIDLRSSLPSRAAEALYWLGRRAERAGTLVHAVRATQASIDQDPGLRDLASGAWERRITAILDAAVISMGGQPGEPALPVSADGAIAAALRSAADEIDGLVEGASTVREFLSTTTWQVTQMLAEQTPILRAGRPAPCRRSTTWWWPWRRSPGSPPRASCGARVGASSTWAGAPSAPSRWPP